MKITILGFLPIFVARFCFQRTNLSSNMDYCIFKFKSIIFAESKVPSTQCQFCPAFYGSTAWENLLKKYCVS